MLGAVGGGVAAAQAVAQVGQPDEAVARPARERFSLFPQGVLAIGLLIGIAGLLTAIGLRLRQYVNKPTASMMGLTSGALVLISGVGFFMASNWVSMRRLNGVATRLEEGHLVQAGNNITQGQQIKLLTEQVRLKAQQLEQSKEQIDQLSKNVETMTATQGRQETQLATQAEQLMQLRTLHQQYQTSAAALQTDLERLSGTAGQMDQSVGALAGAEERIAAGAASLDQSADRFTTQVDRLRDMATRIAAERTERAQEAARLQTAITQLRNSFEEQRRGYDAIMTGLRQQAATSQELAAGSKTVAEASETFKTLAGDYGRIQSSLEASVRTLSQIADLVPRVTQALGRKTQ